MRQVQTLTLDFGTLPASLGSSGLPTSLYDIDQLVLTFRTADGTNYTTNTIAHIFDPVPSGISALQNALIALPGFSISAVTVTGALATDSTSVTYDITFAGGLTSPSTPRNQVASNTVPGNQALLVCPTAPDGSMGCVTAGCRPLFQQARLFESAATAGIIVNVTAIVIQPDALPMPNNNAMTGGQWGVDVYIFVAPNVLGEWTYTVLSDIYGSPGGAFIPTTPIPPGSLRYGVPLVYGLVVDFPENPAQTGGGGARFSWRLPTCKVVQTQAASADYENAECSNRGLCNRATGECACFAGSAGYSCSQQSVIV